MRTSEEADAGPSATAPTHKLRWWKELLIIGGFYALYSLARNQFGSTKVDDGDLPVHAFHNAMRIIDAERAVHLFVEPTIQSWFLPYHWFIRFWDVYYGTFHFVVTFGVLGFLFFRGKSRFTRWRSVLGFTTGLAIVGFSLFPLMPPRLINSPPPYGGEKLTNGVDFGFVDTLEVYGGLWSFDSGSVQRISNQYAAMPSMHIGWSVWCVAAVWGMVRRRWLRYLLLLYPAATLFCIIVTANHFWMDGVGGLAAVSAGYLLGTRFDDWMKRRRAAKGLPVAVA